MCGKFGVVRRDGHMWTHICLKRRHACPLAVDVQTYRRRIEQFVDAICPLATPEEREVYIAEAMALCPNYDQPRSVGAVVPGSGVSNQ